MHRRWLAGVVLSLNVGCAGHPQIGSGGPPAPGPIPSRGCDGRAPVAQEIAHIDGVRASWFNTQHGNERLYVLQAGPRSSKRAPLVLFHGVGEIGTGDFYPVLAHLSRDRPVLAVDLPGFGRSDPEDDDYGPERLVSAVEMVARECAPGKTDLLGHSSGGALAVLYAGKHKERVRRMVLVGVAGILRPEVLLEGQLHQALTPVREEVPLVSKAANALGGAMIQVVQALVPNAKAIADTGLLGDSPSVLAATALLDFNFGYAIERLEAPTLILWGKEDRVAPTRVAHVLDDRIERSELEFIAEGGHVLMRDRPEATAEAVTKFLDGKLPAQFGAQPVGKRAPTETEREGSCHDREDVTFTGDFASITIDHCTGFRLHDVRALRVIIASSEGRIDESDIHQGLAVKDSTVSITGGKIKGRIGLIATESELDLAGVVITGEEAALKLRETGIVASVLRLESPLANTIWHQQLDVGEAQAF